MGGLSRLCEEFHFGELAERLSQFRESEEFKEDARLKEVEARERLLALEERMQQCNCEIASLRTELSRHMRLAESSSEALLGRVLRLEAGVSAFGSLPQAVVPITSAPVPTSPASAVFIPAGWNSAIVPDFPTLFEDFKEKQFTLLWRGSRDGFGARVFHNRCDGHPNTLTVILDTDGNIFGGFTPVTWESHKKTPRKADPSLTSFLFTLKNPHNVPARRFALKAERKNEAIFCRSDLGPCFDDIAVYDNCNANTKNYTSCFGSLYTNDTGLGGAPGDNSFFTGSQYFQVKEIEVFDFVD
jgi:hypothetical protein